MASFTFVGLDTTAETLNDGEVGFIAEGGELVVFGSDAVTGSGKNRLIVNGTLGATTVNVNTESAYAFDGTDTKVIIGQSGLVFSAAGIAFDLRASIGVDLTNNGSIVADSAALLVTDADGTATVTVANNGYINGVSGLVVDSGGSQFIVDNSGTISTVGSSILSFGSGTVTLTNTGTITSSVGLAVDTRGGNDLIINTGTIIGSIETGTGNDLVDTRQGILTSNFISTLENGNDTFMGGVSGERINGGDGEDELLTGGGNDTIYGAFDNDIDLYDGGEGVDLVDYKLTFFALNADLQVGMVTDGFVGVDLLRSIENVTTGDGDDTVRGSGDDNLIRAGAGADQVRGEGGRDRLRGGLNDDTLRGGDGNDRLFGEEDDDRLLGDDGNDLIVGGLGRDVMTGGAGIDNFAFFDLAESGTGGGSQDRITDFTQGSDLIDVSAIDAHLVSLADQSFTFIGTALFSGTEGELRNRQFATVTIVEMDQDGDGVSDMSIRLDGAINLNASDFVL